jgi:hypothetical protein
LIQSVSGYIDGINLLVSCSKVKMEYDEENGNERREEKRTFE